jgi:hypothetical protein
MIVGATRPVTVPTVVALLFCLRVPAGAAAKPTLRTPGVAWTADRVRGFVLETHQLMDRQVRNAYKTFDGRKAMGQCYGEPAKGLVKTAVVLPALEPRLQGKALQCYLSSYFGCRVGDWLAVAGVALRGPSHAPHADSAVKLIEQTTEKVVAEITEVSTDLLRAGVLDKSRIPAGQNIKDFNVQTRYILARDAKGAWRIAEREPASGDWECRLN